MSMKKYVTTEEIAILSKMEPTTSWARAYEILRDYRIKNNIELLNRSWFFEYFLKKCNCRDGKMKGFTYNFVRDDDKKIMHETQDTKVEVPVVVNEDVIPTVDNGNESMTDLLSPEALFVLRAIRIHNCSPSKLWQKFGYSRSVITKGYDQLIDYGVMVKVGDRKTKYDLEAICKDFPEVRNDPTEEDYKKYKVVPRCSKKKQEETPVVKEEHVMDVPDNITCKMSSWLRDTEHKNNEITKAEVINELRFKHKVYDWTVAIRLIEYWCENNWVCKVQSNGGESWRVLSYQIPQLRVQAQKCEEKREVKETPVVKQVQQTSTTKDKNILIKNGNKSIHVINNTNNNIRITFNESDIVIQID